LKNHDINKQTSIPYTPHQNGMVESVNCPIVEMAKNMFDAKKYEKSF
jgi:transposase InsO family protein